MPACFGFWRNSISGDLRHVSGSTTRGCLGTSRNAWWRALVSLPIGTPRTLLADAVHLGRLLWERATVTGDVDLVEDTAQLLAIAANAATDLARVEEAGRIVASQRAEGSAAYVTRTEALEAIEASRQRLHDQLLEVVRAMGGANRRLPNAGGQGA